MPGPEPASTGLRERQKRRRRRSILTTALRLFAERGYDRTTIHDIAAEAEVAARTVTGYFPSKLDFVIEAPLTRSLRLAELYRRHPEIEFVELVGLWWTGSRGRPDVAEDALAHEVALANPGVAAMAEVEAGRRLDELGWQLPAPVSDEDDVLVQAGRAAIHGIDETFFAAVATGRMTDDLQRDLLDLIRVVAAATRVGHGALAAPTTARPGPS